MTINAGHIITVGLMITRCHAGDLAQNLLLPSAKAVLMIVTAIEVCASIRPLQIKDIAKLELLDSLYLLSRDCWVKLVNSLSEAIPINAGDRLCISWQKWY